MKTTRPVGGFKSLLTSLNGDGRWGLALFACLAGLLLLQLGGQATLAALRYDRGALAAGQWWRLASAHVVHLDMRHTLLNGLGLGLMWALFARDYRGGQWALILICAAGAIDLGLWFRDTNVLWYVGASGVLHGVMAAGTLGVLRRGEREGFILAAFMLAKLAYEQIGGVLPFAGSSVPVVVNTHLYGALGGFAAALWMRALPKRL
jgi:rhomboid family GlyGly-CTERM serine protease